MTFTVKTEAESGPCLLLRPPNRTVRLPAVLKPTRPVPGVGGHSWLAELPPMVDRDFPHSVYFSVRGCSGILLGELFVFAVWVSKGGGRKGWGPVAKVLVGEDQSSCQVLCC